jgi:hypothetical protein
MVGLASVSSFAGASRGAVSRAAWRSILFGGREALPDSMPDTMTPPPNPSTNMPTVPAMPAKNDVALKFKTRLRFIRTWKRANVFRRLSEGTVSRGAARHEVKRR